MTARNITGELLISPCLLCSEPLWFDSSALGIHVSCRDAQAESEIPPSPDPIPDSILIENDELRREEEWNEHFLSEPYDEYFGPYYGRG